MFYFFTQNKKGKQEPYWAHLNLGQNLFHRSDKLLHPTNKVCISVTFQSSMFHKRWWTWSGEPCRRQSRGGNSPSCDGLDPAPQPSLLLKSENALFWFVCKCLFICFLVPASQQCLLFMIWRCCAPNPIQKHGLQHFWATNTTTLDEKHSVSQDDFLGFF